MTGSSFLTSARVANSKLAAKLAGDLIRVGRGQEIGVKASARRTSTTRSDRNLPAIIIIGAGRALAAFALPAAPGHARTTAGLLNSCGALRHWSFLRSLLQLRQKSSSGFAPSFHASCVAPAFHEQNCDMEGFVNVQKVFGEFRNAI